MRRVVLAVAWLAAVVLIALGAAGIVAGMDAPATTDAYPWQTARRRRSASGSMPSRPTSSRSPCSSMRSAPRRAARCRRLLPMTMTGPPALLQMGDGLVADITAGPRSPMPSPQFRSSARRRVATVGSTTPSAVPWLVAALVDGDAGPGDAVSARSAAAARMSTLLANHDKTALQAAAQGRRANYAEALIDQDADEINRRRTAPARTSWPPRSTSRRSTTGWTGAPTTTRLSVTSTPPSARATAASMQPSAERSPRSARPGSPSRRTRAVSS